MVITLMVLRRANQELPGVTGLDSVTLFSRKNVQGRPVSGLWMALIVLLL